MRKPAALAVAISLGVAWVGCGHPYQPSTAYALAEQIDGWSPDRSAWMFDHCRLRGVSRPDGITSRAIPFASHVTNALALNADNVLFACPEATPWPRDDAREVAKWLPSMPARFFTCSPSVETPKVTVTVPGDGPAVASATFVRVRARLVDMTLSTETEIHHARPGLAYGARGPGQKVSAGTLMPVDELALVYTQQKSCFGCLSNGLAQLQVGAHAAIACKDESWEVEVLATGGQELFMSDLRLSLGEERRSRARK